MEDIEKLKQEIKEAHNASDLRTEYLLLGELGNIYFSDKKLGDALVAYQEALDIVREMDDPEGLATTYNNIGNVRNEMGDFITAEQKYQRALDLTKQLTDRHLEGSIMNNLGLLFFKQQDKEKATTFWRQALSIALDIGDKKLEGEVLNNLKLTTTYPRLITFQDGEPSEYVSPGSTITSYDVNSVTLGEGPISPIISTSSKRSWEKRRFLFVGLILTIVLGLTIAWLVSTLIGGNGFRSEIINNIYIIFSVLGALVAILQIFFEFSLKHKTEQEEAQIKRDNLRM